MVGRVRKRQNAIFYYLFTLSLSSFQFVSPISEFPTISPTSIPSIQLHDEWNVFRTTIMIYLPSFVAVVLIFSYVRLKYPAVYNVRNTVESIKNPLAATQFTFLSWTWKLLLIDDSEIFRTCGMDALCVLRITRMGSYLSMISLFCSIFLIPVYEHSDASMSENIDPFVSRTATSLPEGSNSFTASVVGAYVLFISTSYLIVKEFRWFIAQRELFLSMKTVRNYTVYVSGIPIRYRSNASLARYFRRVIADDVVLSAYVAVRVPKLKAVLKRRENILQNLERATVVRDLNDGKEPLHIVFHPTRRDIVQRVPAITYFRQQLEIVHREIIELKEIIEQRMSDSVLISSLLPSMTQDDNNIQKSSLDNRLAISVASIVSGSFATPSLESQQEYCSERLEVHMPPKINGKSVLESASTDDSINAENGSTNNSANVHDRSISFHSLDIPINSTENVADEHKEFHDPMPNLETLHRGVSSISDHLSKIGSKGIKKVVDIAATTIGNGDNIDGVPLDAGFVTFTKLSAATVALQTVHSTVPFQMNVFEAPLPEHVLWSNVGLSNKARQFQRLISLALTTLLCIFWTVPVTLLVSLTEVQILKSKLPFLEDWLEAAPWLEQLLNQISPLLLSFLNSVVVPIILRLLSTLEGVLGLSHQETSLFSKLSSFYLIQTFLVASLAGGVTSALATVDTISDVFKYLAKTLPPKSVYFMQLVLIQTVIGMGCELLRTTALLQALIRSRLGPNITKNDQNEPFIGLRPLSNPRYFLYAQSLAGIILRYMILFTYAVLSPFVCYILLFSFIVTEIGFRHQFIYIYPSSLDSGGQLWIAFTAITMLCILVAQIILVTFMALSAAKIQACAMSPLVITTTVFFLYLRQRHFYVAQFVSLETCDTVDTRKNKSDDFPFWNEKFIQPELFKMKKIFDLL